MKIFRLENLDELFWYWARNFYQSFHFCYGACIAQSEHSCRAAKGSNPSSAKIFVNCIKIEAIQCEAMDFTNAVSDDVQS